MPIIVHLDYESQSECNLRECGGYVYSQHPTTRAYCAAMSVLFPDGTKQRIFWTDVPRNLTMPPGVDYEHGVQFMRDMFSDPEGTWIVAHNDSFEHAISTYTLGLPQPARWIDTKDLTLARGLPGGADKAGEYLFGLPKLKDGYNLMMRLCKPNRKGDLPVITDADVQNLIDYVFRDVEISERITEAFGLLVQPEWEQRVRDLSFKINAFGINFDKQFADTLDSMDLWFKEQARKRVVEVTGGAVTGDDLTRVEYLRQALNANLPTSLQLTSMRKEALDYILEEYEDNLTNDELPECERVPPEVVEVIKARLVVSRAALAKVDAGRDQQCADGRLRGQMNFHGASTGRWAGYGVQVHNMKRPDEDFDLPAAIRAVEAQDQAAFLRLVTDTKGRVRQPYELLGSLVRGVLIPSPGRVFANSDFSAIESRGLLYLAGDWNGLKDHIDADNGLIDDVYCAFASKIFGRLIRKKDKKERGAGKVGELACIAEDTPVLTNNGWKPIQWVERADLVWDGHSWVAHDGVVLQRPWAHCVNVLGTFMTSDHLVAHASLLGDDGFAAAEMVYGSETLRTLSSAAGLKSLTRAEASAPDTSSSILYRTANTYDILNCGPRHRFQAGRLVVHNCGYGGGPNAVARFADSMGIDLAAAGVSPDGVVQAWRGYHPKVVQFWRDCENAFVTLLTSRRYNRIAVGKLIFQKWPGRIEIVLPSGRVLTYMNARTEYDQQRGRVQIVYDSAVKGAVRKVKLYGGKIVENIVQAFCRDLLADIMLRIDAAGLDIAFHVHDEVNIDVEESDAAEVIAWLAEEMKIPPSWAEGLPLNCKPEIMRRFGK